MQTGGDVVVDRSSRDPFFCEVLFYFRVWLNGCCRRQRTQRVFTSGQLEHQAIANSTRVTT